MYICIHDHLTRNNLGNRYLNLRGVSCHKESHKNISDNNAVFLTDLFNIISKGFR